MNSYLIESLDSLSLEKEENNLIEKHHMEDAFLSQYDLEETFLQNALEDLDTYGLFNERKVIILKNIESIKYDDFEKEIEHLKKYIEHPNPDYLLIIEAKKLNNTTKIAKLLKKICQYEKIEFDLKNAVKDLLKGYKISPKTVSFLIDYCDSDYTKIQNECDKLKEYKFDEREILEDDILKLVVKKIGDSRDLTFAFSRALAMRDKKGALEKYHELLEYQIEPLSIIGLLASQIRIIYQVKILEIKHLSNREIADTLGEKSDYRIAKTRELTSLYSEKELLLLMQKLSDMDYSIKTSDVDGHSLIEMFIINI